MKVPFSERIRLSTGVPTMTVGGISNHGEINAILASGEADLVVLARPHLYDPYFTRHAAQDQGLNPEWPDPYTSLERYTPRMQYVEPEGVAKS